MSDAVVGAAAETIPGAPAGGAGAPEIAARSPWQLFWTRFKEDRLAMAALIFLAFLAFVAIFAPWIVDLLGLPDPNAKDPGARDLFGTATGPSGSHPLGVDEAGRDVASRVIYGARVSLLVAVVATLLASVAGVISGLVAGYFRGWVDSIVSRAVDVLLAIPYLLLATGLAASCSLGGGCLGGAIQPGLVVVIFVISFTSWTYVARIVRGQVLSLREKEFVLASRSMGASNKRIIFREILPNLVAPIVVYATVLMPQVILYESALSFLGVGVGPRTPSWGQMIAEATSVFDTAWWFMLFPGIALLLTVLAFNLVGDALQDALHPKTRRS